MKYWLIKSEPDAWSWDQQVARGEKGEMWNGVRNHTAKLNLMAMKKGDLAFFYHSNIGKEVVGVVEVIALAHPDSKSDDPRWECVDIKAIAPVVRPISLDEAKAEPRLREMVLVNNSRLSVQPVSPAEWEVVLELAGGTKQG